MDALKFIKEAKRISYLCCSHGVCVDCEVPPNFYCAYGKRRAEKEPPEEGET